MMGVMRQDAERRAKGISEAEWSMSQADAALELGRKLGPTIEETIAALKAAGISPKKTGQAPAGNTSYDLPMVEGVSYAKAADLTLYPPTGEGGDGDGGWSLMWGLRNNQYKQGKKVEKLIELIKKLQGEGILKK